MVLGKSASTSQALLARPSAKKDTPMTRGGDEIMTDEKMLTTSNDQLYKYLKQN